jgi:hypothetical protein
MREDSVIVFLEGSSSRAALQFSRMTEQNKARTFWVKTVPEALDMLTRYKSRLDIVSLGYNLNDEEYNHPAREDTGLEVIRWLEKQDSKQYSHVKFIVHSHSQFATKMASRLRIKGYRVIRVPFGS